MSRPVGRSAERSVKQSVRLRSLAHAEDPLSSATVSVAVAEMAADDTPETFLSAAQEVLVEMRKAGDNQVAVSNRSS